MWKPKPEEEAKTCLVYIDESGQSVSTYFILGALIIPYQYADKFDADILAARADTGVPSHKGDEYKVLKWEKVSRTNLQAYKNTVDAVFKFKKKHTMSLLTDMEINCLAVNTSDRPLHVIGKGDRETAYEIEMYTLLGVCVAKRFSDKIFDVCIDGKFFRKHLVELQAISNHGAHLHHHRVQWPFRKFRTGKPKWSLPLQVVDIFIGALHYKLNGHYDAPNASAAKKELHDYIWKTLDLRDPLIVLPRRTKRLMDWMHRPGPKDYKTHPFQNDAYED
ncbi:MAG: DUF3800 domain-containing protein [Afipia sp.]|nr:DUF3800 domain-containing protein [Afipia sp.]